MGRTSWILVASLLAYPVAAADPVVRVAVFAGEGAKKDRGPVAEAVDKLPGFKAELITADDVRADKLKEFRVLIHPGGSGSAQGKDLGADGRDKERAFLKAGGGYIGICAGAYLASRTYDWSLKVLDAEVIDREHWARGTGDVDVKLSPTGQKFFAREADLVRIYYGQGPLLVPGKDDAIPDYDALAVYETEIHSKNGARPGVMKGTAAAARGEYGAGRVFCFSPHPEKTEPTVDLLHKALTWTAGR